MEAFPFERSCAAIIMILSWLGIEFVFSSWELYKQSPVAFNTVDKVTTIKVVAVLSTLVTSLIGEEPKMISDQ